MSPRREEMVPSLPWVHLGYNQFKSRLQNFSRIMAVHPGVVTYLLKQQPHGTRPSEMVEWPAGAGRPSALGY